MVPKVSEEIDNIRNAVEAVGLKKRFGKFTAVTDVTFSVPSGCVFGLLGPNGAGKTTTLRMLSTVYKPTEGTARIMGRDIVKDPDGVRHSIGVVGESPGLYDRLTARETVRFYGRLYGMDDRAIARRTEKIFGDLGMEEYADRRTEKLSKGMKQKVIIARAMIHDPPVLILDEPTSGLDVVGSRTVMDFIKDVGRRDKTVLLSTHVTSIAQELCDGVAIINKGRIMAGGTMKGLLKKHGNLEDFMFGIIGRRDK